MREIKSDTWKTKEEVRIIIIRRRDREKGTKKLRDINRKRKRK
jgi:hypothetical protein